MSETIEQQTRDSDRIFTAISTGAFDNYAQAENAVVMLYVMDMTVSRSGISHALGRLKKHYEKQKLANARENEDAGIQ